MSDIKDIVTILGAPDVDVFVSNGYLCIGQHGFAEADDDDLIQIRPEQLADLIPVLQRFLDERNSWKDERDDQKPKPEPWIMKPPKGSQ